MINVIGNALASVVIAKWEGVYGTAPEDAVGLEEPPPKRQADGATVSTV
jgi:Na+/H+-dicarboxylate symporter